MPFFLFAFKAIQSTLPAISPRQSAQVCACRTSQARAWRKSAKHIRERAAKQKFIKGFCTTQMNARPASRVVSPVSLSKPTKVHRLLPLPQAIRQVCACRTSQAGAWRESAKRIRERATKQRFIKGFCTIRRNLRSARHAVFPLRFQGHSKHVACCLSRRRSGRYVRAAPAKQGHEVNRAKRVHKWAAKQRLIKGSCAA